MLCVTAIFGTVLTLVLWFYGAGVRAANRHDQSTELFRRAAVLFQLIDTKLERAQVLAVDLTNLTYYAPSEQVVTPQRSFRWSGVANTLMVTDNALNFINDEGSIHILKKIETYESLSFASAAPQVSGSNPDYLDVTMVTTPPSDTREDRRLTLNHRILLGRN